MYESIFGSSSPKFVYDLGGAGETTVQLNHWVTTAFEFDTREVANESEFIADREIISRGEFLRFEGMIYLFKYLTIAEIRSKFEEIYAFNKKKVTLWKHSDGEPFKDSAAANVLFYLEIFPKNFQALDYRDLLILKFRSLKGVEFSDSSTVIPALSEIIMKKTL